MKAKTIILVESVMMALGVLAAKAPVDPTKELAQKARGYLNARRINLRDYDAAKAAFDAALKAETNTDAHALLAFDYGRYLDICGQEPVVTCEKMKRDAYETPNLKTVTKLSMLKTGLTGLSYATDGFRLVEAAKDERLLYEWYREMTRPEFNLNRAKDPLDPVNCDDYKIAKCDEAIARLAPRYHAEFALRKAQLYRFDARWDAAERVYREGLRPLTNVTDRARIKWLGGLADLCVDRAARYYAKPDATWTKKAIDAWREVLKIEPKNTGIRRKIVERAMLVDDYALAEATLNEMTPLMKEAKPDAWMTSVYGDIAFYRGDYEQAVKWYATYPTFPDGPAVLRIPNSHQRYVGALYATGRYEECLKALDACPNFWSFKDVNAVYRKALKEKLDDLSRQQSVEKGVEPVGK